MHTNCRPTYPTPWKEELEAIAKKHDNGRPFHNETNTLPSAFCDEVHWFSERFLTWLEKEYAPECSTFVRTYKNWIGTQPYPAEKSFRGWFSDETSPSPHGGYPGAQWWFETSPQGRVSATLPQLKVAYLRCEELRQKRMEEERIAKEKHDTAERIAKESMIRQVRIANTLIQADIIVQEEERHKAKQLYQEKYAHYKKCLKESLRMRHYASYVKDGEIYPETWQPGFSMDIQRQMSRELGTAAIDKVISEFQRDPEMTRRIETLQREWQEAKAREKKEEEERKAELMARAIVQEQERQKASAPKEESKSWLQKTMRLFNPTSNSPTT